MKRSRTGGNEVNPRRRSADTSAIPVWHGGVRRGSEAVPPHVCHGPPFVPLGSISPFGTHLGRVFSNVLLAASLSGRTSKEEVRGTNAAFTTGLGLRAVMDAHHLLPPPLSILDFLYPHSGGFCDNVTQVLLPKGPDLPVTMLCSGKDAHLQP